MANGTIIATFDEYGEILAYVIVPPVNLDDIIHNNGPTDAIRTYAVEVEGFETGAESEEPIQDALDLLAEVHAIDAKYRRKA